MENLWKVALLAAVVGWTVESGAALASEKPADEPRVIRVIGAATVTAAPDHAQIDLGVVTQAPNAKLAASENAKRVDEVLGAVRAVLGAKADLTTVDYSVNPLYGEAQPHERPKITGYSTQHVVRAATDDLPQVSKIIDAAMGAGANDVRGLSFTLKKEEDVRKRALAEAVAKGKAQAEAIAAALGVKIVGVRSADAAGEPPPVRPMMVGMALRKAEADAPTPVEPGTLDVRASVTLAFDIAP